MRKVLKWLGIGLGGLIGLLILALIVLYALAQIRLNRSYTMRAESITVPTDAAAVGRGRHLAESMTGCMGCHGDGLGGKEVFSDPAIGAVWGPNLTPGSGGIGDHTDTELVMAIRHGIDHDGRGLLIMPAQSFIYLSPEDLGAVIAFIRSMPPVNREVPEPRFTFLANVLVSLGVFKGPIPAEYIDHSLPLAAAPPAGPTTAYGAYLAPIAGCTDCHAETLGGAQPPEPGAPYAPNLTPGGELGEWTEVEFLHAMRTGESPHGHDIDPVYMPWKEFAKMTDEELQAVWAYLQSVPGVEGGSAEE